LINQLKDSAHLPLVLLKYRFLTLQKTLEEIQARNNLTLLLFHSQDQLSFTKGLVLGEKSPEAHYMPFFSNAGMLHVLVASGFNVALVASLAWILVKSAPKNWQFAGILLAIWGYVAFLKFEPPLLRAAWMFSLVFLLKFTGKRTKRTRILLLSIGVILLLQPTLVSSLSLWLSALATLGITVFSRRLSLFWSETGAKRAGSVHWLTGLLLEEGATSLAAQALIFPLLVWFFHQANFVSFLANPLLLPWLGTMTEAAGLEYLLTLLEHWWWARVLLGALAELMAWIYERYFAAVAWWQAWFFLNHTTGDASAKRFIAAWAVIITVLILMTRKKAEAKRNFFHAKT
jgi:ComEC/Rec2-related protein